MAAATFYDAAGTATFAKCDGTVSVPSTAAAADLRGLSSMTGITPGSNANCLYLFDADAGVPSELEGKNVVKGSNAPIQPSNNVTATTGGATYKFVGTTAATGQLSDVYLLNSAGSNFSRTSGSVEPFRAYFATVSTSGLSQSLRITFGGNV